jgi:hypothetical protein
LLELVELVGVPHLRDRAEGQAAQPLAARRRTALAGLWPTQAGRPDGRPAPGSILASLRRPSRVPWTENHPAT